MAHWLRLGTLESDSPELNLSPITFKLCEFRERKY